MKLTHWICFAAVAAFGVTGLQAGPQLQRPTTKCDRLDVGPPPDCRPAVECKKFCVVYQCPMCRVDLIPVRVDLKGGAGPLSQYRTTEYRCPKCRYFMRACVERKAPCSTCPKR
ncbi:MAG TPA: hypothetical protein PLU30_06800 [Verrucomicrobiae bacterium]|nr:hypothetical protein [Verrucomicrobiae bacterium]